MTLSEYIKKHLEDMASQDANFKERRVVQAYGFGNKFSEHHKEIVELVNAHADMIESYNKHINNLKQAV